MQRTEKDDRTGKKITTLRLPLRLLDEIEEIMQADDRSRNYVIEKALERCIPEMKRELGIAA